MSHPLQTSLNRLQQISTYLKAETGLPQTEGWHSPAELFASNSSKLNHLIAYVQTTYQTDSPEIVASALLNGYQWIVIVPALACYLSERRVPDLSLNNVRVRFDEATEPDFADKINYRHGRFWVLPDDPAAQHPDVIVLPNLEALRLQLRTSIESHLDWVLTQLQGVICVRSSTLWRTVADRCAGTIIWLGQELNGCFDQPDRIEAEVAAFIQAPGSALRNQRTGILKITYQDYTRLFLRRGSCCYAFRTPEHNYCATCPLQPRDQRERRLLERIKSEKETVQAC